MTPSGPPPDPFVTDRLPPPPQCPLRVYALPGMQIADRANLVTVLFDRALAAGHGDRLFLRSDTLKLTFAQVHHRVRQIAEVLRQRLGLQPGHRVLLRGSNSIDMALAWLGVVQAGGVAVASMPLLRARELGEMIAKAEPSLALCEAPLLEELVNAAAGAQRPVRIVVFQSTGDTESLDALRAAQPGNAPPYDSAADDIAMMAFTSGTTGTPKAAVHSHRDILAACEAWPRHVLQATPEDIVVGSPPLAFTFGLGGLLLFPLWAGASVYFPSGAYTPDKMVQCMHAVGATICYTAPTFYRQMAPLAAQYGPSRLRICVSAGESLPDATRQLWKAATGIDLVDGIGATEMFHIFISSAGAAIKPGAVGQVVPGYMARVVDDHGVEVPRGTVGSLAVQGPTGCRYLDDARQAGYVKDGWNYPGDAFVQDDDGYFFYRARGDDMIITAGYNVAGPEVEGALLLHPAVAECAVIGVPDAERGMIVKAFVVLKPGHDADTPMTKTLQDHVKSILAPFKYPRQISFIAALPRTETGKLQRFKLRPP